MPKICRVDSCEKAISNKSTGYCHKHHLRYIRNGTTDERKKVDKKEKCIVEDCDRMRQTLEDMCLMHYKRLKRHGTTDLNTKKKICRICDKKAIAKNLCRNHYSNEYRKGDPEHTDNIRKKPNSHGYEKSSGEYKVKHREIAATIIKRKLTSNEIVHHIDMDKRNNDENNLYICSKSEHSILHRQLECLAIEFFKLGYIKFENGKYIINISDSKI